MLLNCIFYENFKIIKRMHNKNEYRKYKCIDLKFEHLGLI